MKKNKISLWILVLILLASSINAITSYNFTFTGGSNESFTVWQSESGALPSYAGNNFTSNTATRFVMIARNLSFDHSKSVPLNATFKYYTPITASCSSSRLEIGLQDSKTGSIYANAEPFVSFCGGVVEIWNGSAGGGKVCDVADSTTGIGKVEVFSNVTIRAYINGAKVCEAKVNKAPDVNDDFLQLMVRNPLSSFDNIAIEDGSSAPPASNSTNVTVPVINNTNPFTLDDLKATATPRFNVSSGNLSFSWYRDGVLVYQTNFSGVSSDVQQESVLSHTYFGRDQVLYVNATATDTTASITRSSSSVTILNSPPTISLARLWSSTNTTSNNILFYVTPSDNDDNKMGLDYRFYKNNVKFYQFNITTWIVAQNGSTFWENGEWEPNPAVSWDNLFDNDYSTYSTAERNGVVNKSIARTNYSIPLNADRVGSKWEIALRNDTDAHIKYNLTINASCWNYPTGWLTLEMISVRVAVPKRAEFYCYHAGGKILLLNTSTIQSTLGFIRDERMYWSINRSYSSGIEYNVANISSSLLSEADVFIAETRSWDGTNYSSWTNTSSLTIKDFPGFTLNYPVNGTSYNLANLSYNYTGWINFTTDINSTVWVNDSRWSIAFTNGTFHSFYNANWALLNDGWVTVRINATSVGYAALNTSLLFFAIDTDPPNQAGNLNGKIWRSGLMGFQINYSDDIGLFSYNISGSGVGFVGTSYKSGINNTFYSMNASINFSDVTIGSHTLTSEVCDGHTKKEIGTFTNVIDKNNKKLSFMFDNSEVSIIPKDANKFTSVSTTKKTDRYGFDFVKDKNNKDIEHTYIVTSTEKINIVGNDKFTGWLVIPSLKKWIDFETSEGYKAKTKRISDYEVEITTKGTSFNSIGSLNCHTTNYTFYKISESVFYNVNVAEGTSQKYLLRLNKTGLTLASHNETLLYASSSVPSLNYTVQSLFFNVSGVRTTNYISVHNTTYTFNFSYVLNGQSFTTSNYNQTVFNTGLVNCTGGDLLIYNISIYHETNLNLLNSSLKGTFYLWTDNSSQRTNTTLNLAGQNNYLICSVANTTMSVDSYLQSINSFTHRYYSYAASVIPGSPTLLPLYNLNETTGYSDFKGTTRKQVDYSYYPNVVTSLQRFYPGENVWRTVQMDLSDEYGTLFFNVLEQSTDYRMIFKTTSNALLKSTSSMKFVCDSGVCELIILLNPSSATSTTENIVTSATYNNVTNLINASWYDVNGESHTMVINISRERLSSSIGVCGFRQASVSGGSVVCNVTGYTGTVKVTFNTNSEITPRAIILIQLITQSLKNFITSGIDQVLIVTAIIVISVMAGVVSPVMTLISGVFGLMVVMWLGVLSGFSITILAITIVLAGVLAYKIKT